MLVSDGKKLIEVEVKISAADLKRDKSKPKHERYVKQKANTPNLFYFAVPKELQEVVIQEIQVVNPKYGLFVYDWSGYGQPIREDRVCVVKCAKPLIDTKVLDKSIDIIIRRMSSEIAGLFSKLYKI